MWNGMKVPEQFRKIINAELLPQSDMENVSFFKLHLDNCHLYEYIIQYTSDPNCGLLRFEFGVGSRYRQIGVCYVEDREIFPL